ncbi:unnamed protein product [Adineta ricciae]|uniref:Nuclear RNA export factor 1-like protein n=1 Tax=Adineta ricciae TaxID=249248 RepID=A0A816C6P5_ADIRI|nr:unnamed protein product [Adineta ricciae]
MSNRNNQRTRHHTDPSSSRYNNAKYHQRNGGKNNRPEFSRRQIGSDDVDRLMMSVDDDLTTNVKSQEASSRARACKNNGNRRSTRSTPQLRKAHQNQIGWWRIMVQDAGNIGKERVMTALRTYCPRQFQAYHYYIEQKNKAGIFFVNSQQDADMLKRASGKLEVQGLDILRIIVSRVPSPIPSLDEDIRPHFKDYLINRRFDQQIFKLDLTNLADDEELSSFGIFPQFNKQAFIREIVDILNRDLHMTRQLDLGSNNIVSLQEFRNLKLNDLGLLSVASNLIKNVDEFDNLKHIPHLAHLFIKNNPITLPNTKRNTSSMDNIISTIQQKIPQLKRIDNVDLPPMIRFATDIESISLPASVPHCVPNDMQGFLAKFIDEYYRLFDTRGREELHACYHDVCMFSLCISTADSTIVPTRHFKFGNLVVESRNLQKVIDDKRRMMLLRQGKPTVLEFLRTKFPLTKHDGNSFHVDVLSTANNRAVFTVNGLYREVEQSTNGPVRCFQRTFTCAQTAAGVLIVADHIMISNATDSQVSKINSATPSVTVSTSQPLNSHADLENQMVLRFSQESGMNIAYSKLCLQENNWNYDKAAEVFLDAKQKNMIPSEAFYKI